MEMMTSTPRPGVRDVALGMFALDGAMVVAGVVLLAVGATAGGVALLIVGAGALAAVALLVRSPRKG